MRHVVLDTDREMIFRFVFGEFIEHRLDHRWRELLRGQAVAATDHAWHAVQLPGRRRFCQSGDDVLVQWFAAGTGFLGTVEHRDRLHRSRQRLQQVPAGKRTVEAHVDHTDAFFRQRIDRFDNGFRARAHQYDDALCFGIAEIIKKVVLAPRQYGKTMHRFPHDLRRRVVESVDGFATLEIDVGILSRAADEGVVGIERTMTVLVDELVVDHHLHLFIADELDLVDFVRGAKAVKEMNKRDPRLQCRGVRD